MCRVLEVSVSGCCAPRSRPGSARNQADRARLEDIRLAHGPRAAGPAARPAGPRRLARAWPPRRPPPGGPPGSRRAGLRGLAALPAGRAHHRGPPWMPDRAQQARAQLRGGGPEPEPPRTGSGVRLGDLTPAFAGAGSACATCEGWLTGLARPHRGHGPRSLLAAVLDLRTRKIVGWSMRDTLHGPDRRGGARDGGPEAAPRPGADLPLGSRRPARMRAPPEGPGRRRDHAVDEPQRLVPRQCPHGEPLPLAQEPAPAKAGVERVGRQPPWPMPSASMAGLRAAAVVIESAQRAPSWLSAGVVGAATASSCRRVAAARRR